MRYTRAVDRLRCVAFHRLCDPLDKNNEKDVSNLFETLAGNFAEIVQYNKDNRFYKNPEKSSVTLETLCDIMVNESIKISVSVLITDAVTAGASVSLHGMIDR